MVLSNRSGVENYRCFLFGLCVTFAHGGCVGWVVIRFESDRGTLDPAVECVYVSWSAIIVEGGNKDLSAIARWQRGCDDSLIGVSLSR